MYKDPVVNIRHLLWAKQKPTLVQCPVLGTGQILKVIYHPYIVVFPYMG